MGGGPRDVPVVWVTGTGVSVEPARATQSAILGHRCRPDPGSRRWTILGVDWRPMFWPSPRDARAVYDEMLDSVTVVVGNRAEVEVAVGPSELHEAASQLLARGVEVALVKTGGEGVLVATAEDCTIVPPHTVEELLLLGALEGGKVVIGA